MQEQGEGVEEQEGEEQKGEGVGEEQHGQHHVILTEEDREVNNN